MKKAIVLLFALLAAVTTTAAVLQHQQQALSEKMVRLHVVANSDSVYDQELKLKVRDAVLTVTESVERKEDLPAMLPQIEAAAKTCLMQEGSGYEVKVGLQKEYFPTRLYSTFSLPAGAYTALRVVIGSGEGQNWWCVSFPSICLCAASDFDEAAAAAGFSEEEVSLITEDGPQYVFKFKILELIGQVKSSLTSRGA